MKSALLLPPPPPDINPGQFKVDGQTGAVINVVTVVFFSAVDNLSVRIDSVSAAVPVEMEIVFLFKLAFNLVPSKPFFRRFTLNNVI